MSRTAYGRERQPFKPDTDTPQTQCPKCGHWCDDHDGFGVMAHGRCGHCSHPSSTEGVCGICGCCVSAPTRALIEKGDTVKFAGGQYVVVDVHENNAYVKIDIAGKLTWQARMAVDFVMRTSVYSAFRGWD